MEDTCRLSYLKVKKNQEICRIILYIHSGTVADIVFSINRDASYFGRISLYKGIYAERENKICIAIPWRTYDK